MAIKKTQVDFRDVADKNVKESATTEYNRVLAEIDKASRTGAFQLIVDVNKQFYKEVGQLFAKDHKLTVVAGRSQKAGKQALGIYWGPSKRKDLGDTRTPDQWTKDMKSNNNLTEKIK